MRIFVNYRTRDEAGAAQLVYRHLSERIGKRNVFLDAQSIEPGTLFDDELLKNVWRSDVMVSIIGERWLDFRQPAGGRAIDDPRDWIHKEILEALTHRVRVVPLLVGAARLPGKDDLPPPLRDLVRHQYVAMDPRMPEAAFARLDEVLDLPSPAQHGDEGEPRARARQSGGIGVAKGHDNINVTDARGPVHIGDRIDRRKGKR
ncbi:toll/interleukin-1 receptor domain-containing protein [Actinophytocola sp.]|uniref:toll/interleukin-1 receptor domain-containing protein n=1 Tax=Actinophytocola sp. TaxID=1872138 RepID=UPI003899B3A9